MNKKGNKKVLIILGVFVLLIILLFVLSHFYNYSPVRHILRNIAEKTFNENQVSDAMSYCTYKCNEVDSEIAAIEFCKTVVAIEAGNKVDRHERFSWGPNIYCEDVIPCFLLIQCPESTGKYDAAECRRLLFTYSRGFFMNLSYANGTGDCHLPTDNADLSTARNWVKKYCFSEDYIAGSVDFSDKRKYPTYESLPLCT